jgi:hypothetical protein
MFISLEELSLSRRFFIDSYSLPPLWSSNDPSAILADPEDEKSAIHPRATSGQLPGTDVRKTFMPPKHQENK